MINPLTGNEERVSSVLRHLASQENCDGVPYDQMQQAANYIDALSDYIDKLERFITKHSCR